MSLLHKILNIASMVPGPQQPFVAGANAAYSLGDELHNQIGPGRDEYRKAHPLWAVLMGQAGGMALDKKDPLRELLMKLRGIGGAPPVGGWDEQNPIQMPPGWGSGGMYG